jgi:mannose-6-phosphate isomerase-like protein (cupin superfamily)
MSAYTALNLLELDDVVGNRAPGIEGRFARSKMESRDLGVSHFRYGPGVRSKSAHTHTEQEEVYVVLEGGGTCKLGDDLVELKAMDAVRIAPQLARSLRAGPDGARLLLFGAPNTDNKDVEMVQDFWDS